MKRPMTLVGFIVASVFLSIDAILELVSLPAFFDIIASGYASQIIDIIVLTFISLTLIILALIFNIICIPKWSCTAVEYADKKGFMITTIVFNFAIILIMFISIIRNLSYGAYVPVMALLLIMALTATNVLVLIDRSLEKKRVARRAETI